MFSIVVISGEWSEWGDWSPCTTTCGAGVQHSTRTCNNPSNGGRDCGGEAAKDQACINKDCAAGDTKYHVYLQLKLIELYRLLLVLEWRQCKKLVIKDKEKRVVIYAGFSNVRPSDRFLNYPVCQFRVSGLLSQASQMNVVYYRYTFGS